MRVVTVLLVSVLASSSLALAGDRFGDPRGDAAGGPDITAVTVTHGDTTLVVSVAFASAPPLEFDEGEGYTDMLLVGIHTDDDLRRSDVEFWTGTHGVDLRRAQVVAAAGAKSRVVGSADVSVKGTTVTLAVERALLGDPDEVAVEVAAGRERASEQAKGGQADFAPASGPHRYALEDGGTPSWLWPVVTAGLGVGIGAAAVLAWRRSCRRHRVGVAVSSSGKLLPPA